MHLTSSFSLNPNFISFSLNPFRFFLTALNYLLMEDLARNLHKIRRYGIPRPSIVVIGDSNIRKCMLLESISKECGLGEDLKDATLPIVLRFENGKERAKYILEHGEESYEVQGKSTLYREIRKAGDADKGEVTLIIKKSDAMENLVIFDYPDFRRRPSERMMSKLLV
ncbi:hypothetical protein Tco_1000520 [Tanacetum coccineum]